MACLTPRTAVCMGAFPLRPLAGLKRIRAPAPSPPGGGSFVGRGVLPRRRHQADMLAPRDNARRPEGSADHVAAGAFRQDASSGTGRTPGTGEGTCPTGSHQGERQQSLSPWARLLLCLSWTVKAATTALGGFLAILAAAAVPVHAARQSTQAAAPASPMWLLPAAMVQSIRTALPYVLGTFAIGLVLAALVKLIQTVWPQPPLPMISEGCQTVRDALKQVYFEKVRPIEVELAFENFHSPCFTAADFNAKPSVLLLGQYSTGKTTFIKHLLGRDYPGMLVGPEPTTDRFVVIGNGPNDKRIPGNTVVITSSKPYQALATFGEGFLSRFEEVQCNHEMLEGISLIDTPGVLSGEKQRLGRAYSFVDVCSWFASRCDMVLLLFDPFKLDISDEFRQVIESMKDHHDKIRVVLNKANQVSNQELMRVYGALMWSLAKVLHSPEVCRVYTGSFADQQQGPGGERGAEVVTQGHLPENSAVSEISNAAQTDSNGNSNGLGPAFFLHEQAELIKDLTSIPQSNRDRKISEFTKRVRAAKTHLILVHHLRCRLPWFRRQWAEEHMIENLEFEFSRIKTDVNIRLYGLAPGDFPTAQSFRAAVLAGNSINSFRSMSDRDFKRKLAILDDVLQRELPHISAMSEK